MIKITTANICRVYYITRMHKCDSIYIEKSCILQNVNTLVQFCSIPLRQSRLYFSLSLGFYVPSCCLPALPFQFSNIGNRPISSKHISFPDFFGFSRRKIGKCIQFRGSCPVIFFNKIDLVASENIKIE